MSRANQTFGDVIREARVARDLGLRELAKQLSMSPSYLSDIENDRRVPAEEVVDALASALALNPDELLARAGRLGDDTHRYLQRNPSAGVLFRRISEQNLPPEDVAELLANLKRRKGRTK